MQRARFPISLSPKMALGGWPRTLLCVAVLVLGLVGAALAAVDYYKVGTRFMVELMGPVWGGGGAWVGFFFGTFWFVFTSRPLSL